MRLLCVVLLLAVSTVYALDDINLETTIADLLATPPRTADDEVSERPLGLAAGTRYGPDTGPVLGAKFTHRDVAATDTTLDIEALYGINGNKELELTVASPRLAGEHLAVLGLHPRRPTPHTLLGDLGGDDTLAAHTRHVAAGPPTWCSAANGDQLIAIRPSAVRARA